MISWALSLTWDSPESIKDKRLLLKLGWVIKFVNTGMCASEIKDKLSIKNWSFSTFRSWISCLLLNSSCLKCCYWEFCLPNWLLKKQKSAIISNKLERLIDWSKPPSESISSRPSLEGDYCLLDGLSKNFIKNYTVVFSYLDLTVYLSIKVTIHFYSVFSVITSELKASSFSNTYKLSSYKL